VQSDGPCGPCSRGIHPRIVPIGETVHKQAAYAQGFERSRFEFAQCADCGSVWVTSTEMGPGREEQARIRLSRGII
jgi:hypothetical protein